MNTVPYSEIETATEHDIGKIALLPLGCAPLAIENTLDECRLAAEQCTGETIERDDIDDFTDHYYLATGDLVAVEIGICSN